MVRFVHNSMRHERIPFDVHIGKFSLRARRGYYESPEFQGEQSNSKWSLVLYVTEGDDYEDFIDIRLRRNQSDGRDLFVELKLAVVDCFGFNGLSEEKKFSFTMSRDTHKVLSVTNGFMSKLNQLRFLPDDTMTVRGEIVVYEETETPFDNREDFENSLKSSRSAILAVVTCIFWQLLTCFAILTKAVLGRGFSAIIYVLRNVIYPVAVDKLSTFATAVANGGRVEEIPWRTSIARRFPPRQSHHGREPELVTYRRYEQDMERLLDAERYYNRSKKMRKT